MREKNLNPWHFTSGTPPRLILQILGSMALYFSVTTFMTTNDLIGFYRGIAALVAGGIILLLREHVSNGDYITEFKKSISKDVDLKKEIAKYISENYTLEMEEPDNTEDVDTGERPAYVGLYG